MSKDNFEQVETNVEQIVHSQVAVETNVNEVSESLDTDNEQENNSSVFMKSLSARVLDEIIIGIISVILLYIFDAILRLFEYNISEKISMLFIIFVIVSIIYASVLESGKSGKTVGKKLFNI